MLLDFTADGLLPAGDYPLTLPELRASMLVFGPPPLVVAWDAPWRAHLVDNLALLVGQLWQVGIDRIFVNGSFVEDKAHPNDAAQHLRPHGHCPNTEVATSPHTMGGQQ